MEKSLESTYSPEYHDASISYVQEQLGLTELDNDAGIIKYKFGTKNLDTWLSLQTNEKKAVNISPLDVIKSYINGLRLIEPDGIVRPIGDTTFFTTAGVQHLETELKRGPGLKKDFYALAQPVIRSQFMDRIVDGTSTSFINYSIIDVYSSPDKFIDLTKKFTNFLINLNISLEDLNLTIESKADSWGENKITKTVVTFFSENDEIGESIFINDYKGQNNSQIPVTDIGFGLERLLWILDKNEPYFRDYTEIYEKSLGNKNDTTSAIDYIRTMVLIAGSGIKPGSKDHGYRIRQLSKRFVQKNQSLRLNTEELVNLSYEYWQKWLSFNIKQEDVLNILSMENDRNYNSLFLSSLEKLGHKNIYIEINQETNSFLEQIKYSLQNDVILEVINSIK